VRRSVGKRKREKKIDGGGKKKGNAQDRI